MNWHYNPPVPFEVLQGKTLASVMVDREYEITFVTTDNHVYKMYHIQDCCEGVYIDDICGDLQKLVGSPITLAEEVNHVDLPDKPDSDESYTWTFYKLANINEYVTIKWYGSSNGYYSESVDFTEVIP